MLGVTSHIQQLRLAKLIDGTKSAIKFLNKLFMRQEQETMYCVYMAVYTVQI